MNGRVFAVNRSPVLAWNIEPQLQVPYPDMPAAAAAAISPIVPVASDPYGRCWQNQVDSGTSFPYFGTLYNNSLPPTAYRLQPGCMSNLGQFWPPTPPPDGCGRFDGSNLYFGPPVLRHTENISSNIRNSIPNLGHYSHLVETSKEQNQRLFKRETQISPNVSAPSISMCSSGSKSDNLNSCCVVDSKMKSQISVTHSLHKPDPHIVSSSHEPYLCAPDVRSSSSVYPSTDKSCFSPSHLMKNNMNFHNSSQDNLHRTKSLPGNQENCNASPLKNVYFSHFESENINSVHSKNFEKNIERQLQIEHKNSSLMVGNKSKHLYSDVFFLISNIFDPRYAFLVYSPLFLSIDWRVGKKIMWVTVIAEWVNQMLKWALHGERPYWWIHETQVYNRTGISTPDIQQFSLTCETGPGSPSGHAMVTAGVWYVILDAFLEKFNFNRKDNKSLVPKICWLAYIILLTTVSASRVFIAAHFPHQCFIGMALGWLVAKKLNNITEQQVGTFLYCAITAGMLASALSMYAFLTAIGVDPMWSVGRAIKWCAKPEYVHLDTTPFFSMMRYCGFMFGMGFGFNSKSFKHNSKSRFSLVMKIACAIISVGVCKLSEKVSLLKVNMFLFYVQAFLLNALLSYVMIAAAPFIVSKIWNSNSKQKTK